MRSADVSDVVRQLELTQPRSASWADALKTIYQGGPGIAVLPPIDGWILIGHPKLVSDGSPAGFEELGKLLEGLSKTFGEAQAFYNYRVNDYHYWIKAVDGALVRGFAYAGDTGELLLNTGRLTDIEHEILTGIPETDWSASESDVMMVAGNWSVDPTTLDERAEITRLPVIATSG